MSQSASASSASGPVRRKPMTDPAGRRARARAAAQDVGPSRERPPVLFRSADEAWLWTMAALVARRERSPRGVDGVGPPRPATPDEVVRCLDTLYRRRRIELLHARILRAWGERGRRPRADRYGERADALIWDEAMRRLEWPLRVKGFLADEPPLCAAPNSTAKTKSTAGDPHGLRRPQPVRPGLCAGLYPLALQGRRQYRRHRPAGLLRGCW